MIGMRYIKDQWGLVSRGWNVLGWVMGHLKGTVCCFIFNGRCSFMSLFYLYRGGSAFVEVEALPGPPRSLLFQEDPAGCFLSSLAVF